MIETKRLKIYAASDEQMIEFIKKQTDDILIKAYTEMLNGSIKHPNMREWYAIWMIELKNGTHIGELCFKGITDKGITEIGYGIDEDYQRCGYGTEALISVVNWAFTQPLLTSVIAEVEETNVASRKILEKAGFKPTGKKGEEGLLFEITSESNL